MSEPVRRRHLRKIEREARRECEAGRAVLPRGKVINRPVVTKLWVNGRASVDGDEWTEKVRTITVDKVLRAQGKMLRNKANGTKFSVLHCIRIPF